MSGHNMNPIELATEKKGKNVLGVKVNDADKKIF